MMGCAPSKDNVLELSSTGDLQTNTLENVNNVITEEVEDLEAGLPGMVSPEIKEDPDSGRSSSSLNLSAKEPLAFEVPQDFEEEGGGNSLIRRHPPLRFRKLEENQVEISQEMINIKQAEAEKRRSALMQDRVKSARSTSARMRSSTSRHNLQNSGDSGIETHMEAFNETELI